MWVVRFFLNKTRMSGLELVNTCETVVVHICDAKLKLAQLLKTAERIVPLNPNRKNNINNWFGTHSTYMYVHGGRTKCVIVP